MYYIYTLFFTNFIKIIIIMKKLSGIGIVLLFALFFSACGGSSDNPQDVAKDFLNALNDKDYSKAKDLGTENTAMMIGMIESMAKMAPDSLKNDEDKADMDAIEWGDTKIDGDNATCFYSTPDKKDQKLDLKKVDGKWKVDMKKDM